MTENLEYELTQPPALSVILKEKYKEEVDRFAGCAVGKNTSQDFPCVECYKQTVGRQRLIELALTVLPFSRDLRYESY